MFKDLVQMEYRSAVVLLTVWYVGWSKLGALRTTTHQHPGGTKSRGWSVGDRGRAAAMGVCASKPGAEPPKPEASAPLGSGVNESVPPRSAAAREQLWPTTAGGGTPSPTPSSR